ncbi:MAG TPA: GH116 family glycosyl hydrolase [Planctomycetota bacterium]|nr:GH116 family glycosyl hydrolase [Planctomycetota bacterium]
MAVIERTIENTSGIPLGGIGTGSVEIREDGLFHDWQIFNLGAWSPQSPQPSCCGSKPAIPTMRPEDLAFIVRTESECGGIKTRRLAMREQLNNLYSMAWLKCVQSIRFWGEFPIARLEYKDDTLPVEITAEVFAPFIPHDPRESGTPGFHVRFIVRNLTGERVKVSILSTLANPIPCGERVHTVEKDGNATLVTLAAEGNGKDEPCNGSITLGVRGGDHSYITGAYRQERGGIFIWAKTYGLATRSYIFDFRNTGRLPNLTPERAPEDIPDDFKAESLSAAQRKNLLQELLKHPAFYYKYKRIADCEPALLQGEDKLSAFLNDVAAEMKNHFRARKDEWRDALLCSENELEPHAETSVIFTLGWFFPNHISPKSGNIGHMYSKWFDSSAAVCKHLIANYDDARAKTVGFAEALFDTSLDYFVADSISAQLSTIPKCTWWTRDGDFGVWEGLGCCGFHTTDITYDGSFSLIALFPTLQKQQMIMGAKHQRNDGRIPHFFIPDFSQTDGDYARVDMNPQFVLLVARDYLWTGDRKYLETLWEPVVKAIENTNLLDADKDGLPDHDCERQTYDAWDFYGCPSYIASLWLASLKAGIRLAEEMQDTKRAARWRQWYNKGVKNFEKLWNGEYYVLWREMHDGGRVDECCMTDQIDGDWFTALMGWGPVLPVDRIRAALSAIFDYNYNTEDGLKNATYPPGKPPRISTYMNLQAEAPWTGIEYAIASMFIDYGMIHEGIAIAHNIYDRYERAGRVWNHVECGDHYYRAMSSWALLLSLTGFRVDVPSQTLTIAPALKQDRFRAPYVSSSSWGSYTQETGTSSSSVNIQCLGGKESFKTLRLSAAAKGASAAVTLNGKKIACSVDDGGGTAKLEFAKPVKLVQGDTLAISLA